jgi:uncharacterized Fe-S cluster protein YjdI
MRFYRREAFGFFVTLKPQRFLKPLGFTHKSKIQMDTTREYTNGEVTIVWKAELCIHSGICARGLPGVFKPREKPWIHTHAATTDEIIAQVKRCPSGALSTHLNSDTKGSAEPSET